jgi:HSP20 family protein
MNMTQVTKTLEDHQTNASKGNCMTPQWSTSWPRAADLIDGWLPSELSWRGRVQHMIKIEEFPRDGLYVLRAEMPGVDSDKDIDVEVSDSFLTITFRREGSTRDTFRSEFDYGEFYRSVALPSGAKSDDVKATYKDGILEVVVPIEQTGNSASQVGVVRN